MKTVSLQWSKTSESHWIDLSVLEQGIESFIDWAILASLQDVQQYVDRMRASYATLPSRELAQKIVDEQAFYSGVLGAVTGMGPLPLLPVTLPLDLIKLWKIQDFTIKCIAYIYGYTPQNADLKTALVLLMSNGSMEELKEVVMTEAAHAIGEYTWGTVDTFKKSAVQFAAQEGTKHAAKALSHCGEKALASVGMKEVSKHLTELLCKVGGKKIAEKVLEKSLDAAVPIFGAIIGGGVDWVTTQTVGKLAIEYFANSGPEFVNHILTQHQPRSFS